MDMYSQWSQQYAGMDPAAAQMYWQQYYGGYGPPQPFYGYGAPPAGMPPGMPPMTTGAVPPSTAAAAGGPIPPVEPPKEEQPPLPAEPPPPEEEKSTTVAVNPEEQTKLSALQMQAAQWQQQKQWEEYQQNLTQYQQQLQQWNTQQATLLEQVTKEEMEFETQYKDWVKQYNDWKEQNKNHPNKDQYNQYEQQWKQYEEQMSQKREYIQQRKRTLLQNQQPSHLTAPTAPPDYVAPSSAAVPTTAPTTAATTTFPTTTSAPAAASYASSAYGGSVAAAQVPPAVAPSHYDYSAAGMSAPYSGVPQVPPPSASAAVPPAVPPSVPPVVPPVVPPAVPTAVPPTIPPAVPGYPPPPLPGYGGAPLPFPARYPPPPLPSYGTSYGYPGMMMPPPDLGYGSATTGASTGTEAAASAWNATSTGSASTPAYGQRPGYAQSSGQTSAAVSTQQSLVPQNTQAPMVTSVAPSNTSNSQFFGPRSIEPAGVRPTASMVGPRGFGNQGEQRWPGPRPAHPGAPGQSGGFGQQKTGPEGPVGPRTGGPMGPNTVSGRPPGPGGQSATVGSFGHDMDSFNESLGPAEEEDRWQPQSFDQNETKNSSGFGMRPGAPGGMRPGAPGGIRAGVPGGMRPGVPGAFGPGNFGPRSDGGTGAGTGTRLPMMRGPRPLGNQQLPRWQPGADSFEERVPEEPEADDDMYPEGAGPTSNTGTMGFGQPRPRFPGAGIGPTSLPRGVRPGFGDTAGGPVSRPGWGGPRAPGPRMRLPGPHPGEERSLGQAEDAYNEDQIFNSNINEEHYDEENFDENNEYNQEDSSHVTGPVPGFGPRDAGFTGRFGATGQQGLRSSGGAFHQQPPFGVQRPRMDLRAPGGGFGARGFGGPPAAGNRPRGPVPLMDIRVRPPSLSEKPPLEKSHGEDDYDEKEELLQDEVMAEEDVEFNEDESEVAAMTTPSGIRPLVPLGLRPRMAGPRGFLGEKRPMEPGAMFQPRGQRMPDMRGQLVQRFPSPRGPGGPRGPPSILEVGQRPLRPGFGDASVGQRGPRPLFGDLSVGMRSVRPGFGESRFGRPPFGEKSGGFSRGSFPRGPRMEGPPRFGGPASGESFAEEEYGYDEAAGEEEFASQEENWQQTEGGNEMEQWQQESEVARAMTGQGNVKQSVKRDDGKLNSSKPLKLSEHEHDLIKKATEELMQKKLPSLDILSKFMAPSDKSAIGSVGGAAPGASGGQKKELNPENRGEEPFKFQGQKEANSERDRFAEELPFGAGRGREKEFPGDRRFGDRPGPFDIRRGFPPGRPEDQPFSEDRDRERGFPPRDRPFMPDRMPPPGERPFPPRDRPFPDERRFGERGDMHEGRQEFEPEFRGPPRPGPEFEQRGPHWANRFGMRGPGDDGPRGPPGEERDLRGPGPRDDPFFRGPRDDMPFRGPMDEPRMRDMRGEFGFRGPPKPDFDQDRRMFEERGPPSSDWEHGEPRHAMNRFDRGGRLPRPPGAPRDLFDTEEFPPRPPPFGFGRGGPPSLMDLRPVPPGPATVIDYGHGQSDSGMGVDERRFRDEGFRRRPDEEMRRDRREGGNLEVKGDREFGRHGPPDMRREDGRPFREEGPPRHRSRSPPFPRDTDPRGHDRGNFERMMRDRGNEREPERQPPGVRGGAFDMERPRFDPNEDMNRRRERESERPGANAPRGLEPFGRGPPRPLMSQQVRPVVEEIRIETVLVDDLLVAPGRQTRPDHIVVIIRGPPGAGKTYVSKLLKDKEVNNGGTAPRMLCLDDYFVVETEKTVTEPETGRKIKKMVMEYEYDAAMEPAYRVSFLKSFKRQIDDCFFNFIIVDAIFDKVAQLEEFWSYAKSKGFQVYIVEVHADVSTCTKRNTHQRSQADLQKIVDGWEETPKHYIRLDIRSLLQEAAIEDVEMEDTTAEEENNVKSEESKNAEKKDEDEELEVGYQKSKWELDTSEQQLDKLDGLRMNKKKKDSGPQRLQDYLQLPDDYESRTSQPGKKRVRWADIEERKDQLRRREIGFVVGQTDWAKMTDDSYADRALNRTKYF